MLLGILITALLIGILLVGLIVVEKAAPGLIQRHPVTTSVILLLQDGILLLVAGVIALRAAGRNAPAALGLRRLRVYSDLLLPVPLLLLSYAFNLTYGLITVQIRGEPFLQPNIVPLFGDDWTAWLGAGLAALLIAPVTEEIFFRGFVFGGLRQQLGLWGAALLSGLFFGSIHLDPGTLIPVAFLGTLLAYLYNRTQSLYPCILLHVLNNGLGLIALYLLRNTPGPRPV